MAGMFPRPKKKSDATKVEFLDWARLVPDLALAETTLTHRQSGWQIEKPNMVEKSYLAQRLSRWIERAAQTGLFIESCEKTITVGGTIAAGDERIAVIDGTINVTYTTAGTEADNDEIAAGWYAALLADTAVMQLFDVTVSGAVITLRARLPGYDIGVATVVTPASGTPTAVVANVRVAPYRLRLSDEDLTNKAAIDFVFGSSSTEHTGSGGEGRMLFDKSKAAFRAGWCDSTQWDDASRGLYSAAWGRTCSAPADYSTAGGFESFAGGDGAVAIGYQCNVSANHGTAFGYQCTAGNGSFSAGFQCAAGGTDAVSIGYGNTASHNFAVALGARCEAIAMSAVAIGESCRASALGALCTGAATDVAYLQAIGKGARAHGCVEFSGTATAIIASGDGADAHGASAAAYEGATASGDLSRAHGRGVTASADYSRAYGDGAVASAHGEVAHASGCFINGGFRAPGTAQAGSLIWMGTTTNNTPTALQLGGSAGEWTPPAGTYCADLMVSAAKIAGTIGETAAWRAHIAFYSDGTNLSVTDEAWVAPSGISSSTQPLNDYSSATASVGDDGAKLRVTVEGLLTTDIRWIAKLDYVRVS